MRQTDRLAKDEMYAFDLETREWLAIARPTAPETRYVIYHTTGKGYKQLRNHAELVKALNNPDLGTIELVCGIGTKVAVVLSAQDDGSGVLTCPDFYHQNDFPRFLEMMSHGENVPILYLSVDGLVKQITPMEAANDAARAFWRSGKKFEGLPMYRVNDRKVFEQLLPRYDADFRVVVLTKGSPINGQIWILRLDQALTKMGESVLGNGERIELRRGQYIYTAVRYDEEVQINRQYDPPNSARAYRW